MPSVGGAIRRLCVPLLEATSTDLPKVASLGAEHLDGAQLLPDRLALADRLPKKGVGAEIGVAFGDYTAELVARAAPEHLYLIDSWDSARYRAGFEKVRSSFPDARILCGLSTQRIADIPNNSLDWCYIDTDHSYATTAAELELILPKMKRGGRVAGDDYANGNPHKAYPYGVIPAVSDFCVRHGWCFEFLTMECDRNPSFCLKGLTY